MPSPYAVCCACLRVCSLPVSSSAVADGKLLAPGNLRAVLDNPGYADLHKSEVNNNEHHLRYTGGMILDVSQILVKGEGAFRSPQRRPQPFLP